MPKANPGQTGCMYCNELMPEIVPCSGPLAWGIDIHSYLPQCPECLLLPENERFPKKEKSEPRGYVSFMGLPVEGVSHIPDGLHKVPSFTVRGSVYQPCYLSVQDDVITAYGMQPHLMTRV